MTPGPTQVPLVVRMAMLKHIIHHQGPEFHELYERIIENAKYAFQTETDIIVPPASGTGGVECVVNNVVHPGDKVAIGIHGSFCEKFRDVIKLNGGIPIEVPSEWNKAPTLEKFERVLEKEEDVKAVVVICNETSTGVKIPNLEEIGKLVKDYGALYIVDAISMLGGDELPVDKWKIDICITGSQKCLACPPGLSLISVSEECWKTIEKINPRSNYFNLLVYRDYFHRFRETPQTPSIPLFYALDEALLLLREEGLEKRIKRHRICAQALYSAVEAIGLSLFADEWFRSNTVVTINTPSNMSSKDVCETVKRQGVIIVGGVGKLKDMTFRIGNMGTVSSFNVLATVYALENALLDLGFKFEKGAGVEACRNAVKAPN